LVIWFAPQPSGLPGAQIVEYPAEHIWPFTGSGDEFKVLENDTRKTREQSVKLLARLWVLLE
jgi:hypothetical protein